MDAYYVTIQYADELIESRLFYILLYRLIKDLIDDYEKLYFLKTLLHVFNMNI